MRFFHFHSQLSGGWLMTNRFGIAFIARSVLLPVTANEVGQASPHWALWGRLPPLQSSQALPAFVHRNVPAPLPPPFVPPTYLPPNALNHHLTQNLPHPQRKLSGRGFWFPVCPERSICYTQTQVPTSAGAWTLQSWGLRQGEDASACSLWTVWPTTLMSHSKVKKYFTHLPLQSSKCIEGVRMEEWGNLGKEV